MLALEMNFFRSFYSCHSLKHMKCIVNNQKRIDICVNEYNEKRRVFNKKIYAANNKKKLTQDYVEFIANHTSVDQMGHHCVLTAVT